MATGNTEAVTAAAAAQDDAPGTVPVHELQAGLGAPSVSHTLFPSQQLCFGQRTTQLLLSSEVGLPYNPPSPAFLKTPRK